MKMILTALVGLALLTAACGDDDEAEAAPTVVIDGETAAGDETDAGTDSEATETDATDATDEELALAFAQCMRDNGVPEFPDPVVNADGSIELAPGGPGQGGLDPESNDLQGAIEVCGDIVAGASFLPGADRDEDELEDDLLAMSQCLRDLGYDVDDPDLSAGFGPGAGGRAAIFGEDFDPTDPANADALQECQQSVFGATGPRGSGQESTR